jgi:hypothetical protein
MNDKADMGYSMVVRDVDGSQLRYTEWVLIKLVDNAKQIYKKFWNVSLGVELYNHTASGLGWGQLENVNIASTSDPVLLDKLSKELRAAWA